MWATTFLKILLAFGAFLNSEVVYSFRHRLRSVGIRGIQPRGAARSDKLLEDARKLREEADRLLEEQRLQAVNGEVYRKTNSIGTLFMAPNLNTTDIQYRMTTKGQASNVSSQSPVMTVSTSRFPKKEAMAEKDMNPILDSNESMAKPELIAPSPNIDSSTIADFNVERDLLIAIGKIFDIAQDIQSSVGKNSTFCETRAIDEILELIPSSWGWFGRPMLNNAVNTISKVITENAGIELKPESHEEKLFTDAVTVETFIAIDDLLRMEANDNLNLNKILDKVKWISEDKEFIALCIVRYEYLLAEANSKGSLVNQSGDHKLSGIEKITEVIEKIKHQIKEFEARINTMSNLEVFQEKNMIDEEIIKLVETSAEFLKQNYPHLETIMETLGAMKNLQPVTQVNESSTVKSQKDKNNADLNFPNAAPTVTPVNGSLAEQVVASLEEILASNARANAATTAERLIVTFFDDESRASGGLNREHAGKFQNEILRDMLSVTSVKMMEGAAIFEGSIMVKKSSEFAYQIGKRFDQSSLKDEVGYTIMQSERTPNISSSMEAIALDMLLGSTPAVIVFPKAWNSTVTSVGSDPLKILWRNLLSSASVITSASFAAGCLNLFDENGPFLKDGVFPDNFILLALVPTISQYLSILVEKLSARSKGFDIATVIIPTFTLFNFGVRSTYVTMPKNRNDLFDVAAISSGFAIVNSLALVLCGLSLTAAATKEAILNYPTMSVSLLKTNTVMNQLISNYYPGIFSGLSTEVDTLIHVHWLAIVGASMFIANILQLLPIDNSAGCKMYYAVFGKDSFDIIASFASIIKAFFIIPFIFNTGGVPAAVAVMTKPLLLLNFILSSQLAGSSSMVSSIFALVSLVLHISLTFSSYPVSSLHIISSGYTNYC